MSLLSGDLTTPWRASTWLASAPALPSNILSQLITSMSGLIYGKLNRARTYSQIFVRTFDGLGNMQLVLPDYPVTSITSIQEGSALIQASILPTPGSPQPTGSNAWYGYRFIPWEGALPGSPTVVEFANGYFWTKAQNIRVTYQAGYLVSNEAVIVPAISPYQVTVLQSQGIWCRDNGVTYAANGTLLVPVTTITAAGQYIPPPDSNPGQYTFGSADAGASLLISYSFIPSPLEEACNQMVAERLSYRSRIGEISKSLGGQESVRFQRGSSGRLGTGMSSLPPEVVDLINDYISVLPPNMGAPL